MEGTDLGIRWGGRRHMPPVLEIEQRSFNAPWDEAKFIFYLQKRNHIFKVCESGRGLVHGFIIYELGKTTLRILNLAVAPEVRRTGVGSFLVDHLKDKLSEERRRFVEVYLLESNLQAQLFFTELGFRITAQKKAQDIGYDEDLYLFRYSVPLQGTNRISQYFEEE